MSYTQIRLDKWFRPIPKEYLDWLLSMYGETAEKEYNNNFFWNIIDSIDRCDLIYDRSICFYREEDALAFKLKFGI